MSDSDLQMRMLQQAAIPDYKRRSRIHSIAKSRLVPYPVASQLKFARSNSEIRNLPTSVQKNLMYGAKFTSMSIVRRYFLLFVFLDLSLHLISYVLYLTHASEYSLFDLIQCQMICYDIETSFVDIAALAVGRFLILETIYGIGQSNSWIGTALTTAITTVFVIVKLFLYEWESECQTFLPAILFGLTFALSWLEAFLVDFQLIEKEKLAQKYAAVGREILQRNFSKVGLLKSIFTLTKDLFSIPTDLLNLCESHVNMLHH